MCLNICIIINFLLILNFICKNMATTFCDEDTCGSIVSKCILTERCDCEQKDLSCYKDCIQCMGKKYFEDCCSCLDLCPRAGAGKVSLSHKSHVEEFEGLPELFDVFVSLPADALENSWNIFNFETILINSKENEIDTNLTVNCTVAYFDHCVSWNKCRQSCRNTGASSYRWFHDGCCECVGSTCLNYGLNESRCKFCPDVHDQNEFEVDFDDPYDF